MHENSKALTFRHKIQTKLHLETRWSAQLIQQNRHRHRIRCQQNSPEGHTQIQTQPIRKYKIRHTRRQSRPYPKTIGNAKDINCRQKLCENKCISILYESKYNRPGRKMSRMTSSPWMEIHEVALRVMTFAEVFCVAKEADHEHDDRVGYGVDVA